MLEQILKAITEYANSGRSEDLREWLVDHVQAVLDSQNPRAIDLVNEWEAAFARLSENLITEAELFDRATAVSRIAKIDIRPLPITVHSNSTTSSGAVLQGESIQVGRSVRVA